MPQFYFGRLPENDDELWQAVKTMWGVVIPRHTCGNPDHTPPFQAFADAYFNRGGTITLWHGSRGLSGKSFMLGILGLTKAFLLGADTNLLGGSLAQSSNLHEHMRNALNSDNSPRYMIETESQTLIKLSNKAKIRPLTASQKTVRGPHPPFLILDEIDEMDIDILDAALGQPMPQKNYMGDILQPYTVMCIAEGAEITVKGGNKFIEQVEAGDLVLTREGWKPVEHVTFMGYKPTVTVMLSNGESLTCTADHKIATSDGWVEAGSLAVGTILFSHAGDADAVPTVATDADVAGVSHVVSSSADSGALLMLPSPSLVLGVGDDLHVSGVRADGIPAQVVKGHTLWKGAVDLLPDPPVSEHGRGLAVLANDLVPVGAIGGPSPRDALIRLGDEVADPDPVGLGDVGAAPASGAVALGLGPTVLAVVNHGLVLPTWDIGVEECHEFVANSIVVKNCSTWQNPEGTFTEVRRRFEERRLPIVQWCYACSANPIDGWLTQETIDAKKLEIPAEMWRTEYELGEPAIGNRAFDTVAVDLMFDKAPEPLSEKVSKGFEEYTFKEYERDGYYVAGADWGKEQDYTVISVWRADRTPYELVYYMRVNRRPYPQMIGWFNDAIQRYSADAIHDGTGLGNVVNDYVDIRARSFTMTGEKRAAMLTEYVNGVEKGMLKAPRIKTAYLAHKYAQVGDLYSNSKEFHLPDEVCSFALAYRVMNRGGKPSGPITVKRDNEPSQLEKMFSVEPSMDVYIKDEEPSGFNLMV